MKTSQIFSTASWVASFCVLCMNRGGTKLIDDIGNKLYNIFQTCKNGNKNSFLARNLVLSLLSVSRCLTFQETPGYIKKDIVNNNSDNDNDNDNNNKTNLRTG